MIISINPDTVTTVAGKINSAYLAVEDAKKVLQSITTHNDWACKERDDINEYILICKRNVNEAFDKAQRFAWIMQDIASDFSSEEKQVASMFQSVEDDKSFGSDQVVEDDNGARHDHTEGAEFGF